MLLMTMQKKIWQHRGCRFFYVCLRRNLAKLLRGVVLFTKVGSSLATAAPNDCSGQNPRYRASALGRNNATNIAKARNAEGR